MSNKMICPVCGGDIQYNHGYSTYDCLNNPAEHYASEDVWQALIQAKQDLEITRKALDKADRFFEGTIGLYQSEMHAIIKTALEQIEYKE